MARFPKPARSHFRLAHGRAERLPASNLLPFALLIHMTPKSNRPRRRVHRSMRSSSDLEPVQLVR